MQLQEKTDKFLLAEQKIIHLLLKHKQVVEEIIENRITQDFFSDRHKLIVFYILKEYMDNDSSFPKLLTRDSYQHYLIQKYGNKGEILACLKTFDTCIYKFSASPDDLSTLKKELMNGYAARHVQAALNTYEKSASNKGVFLATQELADGLSQISTIGHKRQNTFGTIQDFRKEYLDEKTKQRENPDRIIKCGIEEFDKVMGIGLAPQTLTLIVADTGSGKSTSMICMGLNIAKAGHNILFISLEMDRTRLIDRIITNISGLDFNIVAQPHLMKDEQFKLMQKSINEWENVYKGNFAILDTDEWITVSSLRREIELRSMIYKPDVVIVDYIGMVKPENRYKDRHDIELGEISKSLRFMGKKYGFATISASQLNREAIRRMRKNKEQLAGSEDLRGSGELSNDADYIFALFPTSEGNRLKGQTIKSRHGISHNTFNLYFNGKKSLISDYNTATILIQDMDSEFSGLLSTTDDSDEDIDSDPTISVTDDLDLE